MSKENIVLDFSLEEVAEIDDGLNVEVNKRKWEMHMALVIEGAYIDNVDTGTKAGSVRHFLRNFDSLGDWEMDKLVEYCFAAFGVGKEHLKNETTRDMILARLNNLIKQ